ncbi:Uu.00g059400.m01.CDS01 [Anthostomella pinea]|uniref:Uu.00g059400.m01.CDS01 n=1 Tax=Anthostomella pinea TaxID=933095 RepID=A0AAI8YMH1_9PEZI|nr:Uu.00g059400.m01.CDS01 [Anthostomella pinea]
MATHSWQHRAAEIEPTLRIACIDSPPAAADTVRGVIFLIHGFPQTSYQFRHVIEPLSPAGYRVIAPDCRGAGASSKPPDGFTKTTMTQDLVRLLDVLGVTEPVHVVGHDIGGMIAYDMAARYSSRVASVNWGECPLRETPNVLPTSKSDLVAVEQRTPYISSTSSSTAYRTWLSL